MKFVEWCKPKDIIASFILIYCIGLIGKGINSIVSGITIAIISYYFGRRIDYKEYKKNGKML